MKLSLTNATEQTVVYELNAPVASVYLAMAPRQTQVIEMPEDTTGATVIFWYDAAASVVLAGGTPFYMSNKTDLPTGIPTDTIVFYESSAGVFQETYSQTMGYPHDERGLFTTGEAHMSALLLAIGFLGTVKAAKLFTLK